MKTGRIIPAWTAALAAAVLALCLLALPAGAAEIDSGTCGSNAVWELDSDGTLTISGTGTMTNWWDPEDVPWYDYAEEIEAAVIEDGITRIGSSAFEGCTALTEVTIADSVTSIGAYSFLGCTALTEIEIPDSVTIIYGSAFADCTGLTVIEIPDSITSIYTCAFSGCTSLESITIPDSITSLEYEVFEGCTSLTEIFIPDSVTSIGISAFEDCTALETITLPDGLTSLGASAFRNCTSLESITIPDGVTSIGTRTFAGCTALREITLPEALTSIGNYAFDECTSLTEIEIPDGVTSLGDYCFLGCTGLTEASLPESLTSIGVSAFSECTSLESIHLPDSLTTIGSYAFYSCSSLTGITIPESVTMVSKHAFYRCTGLTDIIFLGSAPEIGENAFYRVTANAFYPEEDESWTEEVRQDYGGTLTWVAYGEDTEDFVACAFSLSDGAEVLISETLSLGSTVDLSSYEAPSQDGYTFAGWMDRDCTLVEGEITITGDLELYAAWTPEEESSSGSLLLSLDSGELDYTSSLTVTMQIASEERNGIYFLSEETLGFYSLDYYGYVTAYVFDGCDSAYVEGDMLYVLDDFSCYVYDLKGNTLDHTVTFNDLEDEESVNITTAIGVDSSGRLYIATRGTVNSEYVYKLWLCSADGDLLSSAEAEDKVYSFSGFDADSGLFFMESDITFTYWGYTHYGIGLTMGQVEDDSISYLPTSGTVTYGGLTCSIDALEFLCYAPYYSYHSYDCHQTSAALLGGEYLVYVSQLAGTVSVMDDLEELSVCLSLSRESVEEEQEDDFYDLGSIGVRAVWDESAGGILFYENGKLLNEYDPETGEILYSGSTSYYVFNLLMMGDQVIAIEKEDGAYYLEVLDWTAPSGISIEAEADTMQAGESQQLTAAVSGSELSAGVTWSSSDDSILSVTDSGLVSAWSEGEAVITCTTLDGTLSASCTIRVSGSLAALDSEPAVLLSGTVSDNLSDNDITTYYSTRVNSYLYENEDGTLTRVEYLSGTGVLVEVLDPSDGSTLSSETLDMELPIWGGFYSGEEYNFLVFGQTNSEEDDDVEVIRVVKYSKDWERLDSCSICGANTYAPFNAGSLRMTETDGNLYLYTCHTMYESSDGLNHQANMTFVLDEESMEVVDSYYDVMNISYGYVSHSFAQFIQTDGEYLYRVDLGDGAPRAVSITKTAVGDDVTDLESYTYALSIGGSYASNGNYTGASIGGFELSTDNCLIAVNSVDQEADSYSTSSQRNICLLVTDQDSLETEEIWLTDYEESDGITPRTPQLVKITDDQFLLLWEEEDSSGNITTRMVTLNGDGTLTSDLITSDVRLSDCQPIVTENRIVTWYVTDGETAILYQLNPYSLEDYGSVDIPAGSEEEDAGSDSEDSGSSSGGSDSSDSGSGADENSTEEDSSGGSQDSGSDEDGSGESEDSSDDAGESSGYSSGYLACLRDGTCPICQFTDADPAAWYHDGVHFCIENGLMNGTSSITFEPSTATTRNMIVTMLYRLAGEPEVEGTSSFTDVVAGSWYEDAVIWAEQTGIAKGYDTGEFGVSDEVTREQIATFFCRYAEIVEKLDVSASADLSGYPDADEVSSWAYSELSWAVSNGLITGQGVGDETWLAPGSDAARSETATILMRFMTSFITE